MITVIATITIQFTNNLILATNIMHIIKKEANRALIKLYLVLTSSFVHSTKKITLFTRLTFFFVIVFYILGNPMTIRSKPYSRSILLLHPLHPLHPLPHPRSHPTRSCSSCNPVAPIVLFSSMLLFIGYCFKYFWYLKFNITH